MAYAIASVLAMAAMPAYAGGPPPLSQAWLAQSQHQTAAQAASSPSGSSAISAQTPTQLLQQRAVQQSLADLGRAAQAVAAQIAAQQSAQQAAQQQASPIPNGLTPGGLVVASGTASNPSLWQNANAPTQSTSNGQTTVQVKQTAQKAVLTWNSFNVGRNTTLYFNQSGGNQTNGGANNWIVLNRVNDPSGVPSQIFGQIKAEGTVYLLNHNGVLFGAGSQVNTQSLLASSLDLFSGDVNASNSAFLGGGIAAGHASVPFLVNGIFTDGGNHDVVVQQGASIASGPQGFVLLAAPNVSNAGSIVADDGQAILAAGVQFDDLSAGVQTAQLNVFNAVSSLVNNYPGGTATNTGLVQARRGQVHMLGYNVDQDGIALASTSISYPGSIELNARDQGNQGGGGYARSGALVLGPDSVTAILPEKDGATTTSSSAANAAFTPGSLSLSGDTVTFQSGSLLEAPNAKLSVLAEIESSTDPNPVAGRIYVDNGAVIDVSGLADVDLPMSALLVTIPRIGQNELADSPLLRNSFLYTQKDVVVDSTQSGTTPDGLSWVGSPILNVSGYVQDVPRDITQLMTAGGSIDLNGYEVIVRSGAQLNLDGGYLAYQPGWITTPNLLGANGRVYNIADADPNMAYVGFAGEYTVIDNRWGVTTNYSNPLLAGAPRWDNGFAVGGNAGTLSIETLNAVALDGQISAQAFAGRNQVTQGTQPAGGTFDISTSGNSILVGRRNNNVPSIVLQQSSLSVDQLDPQFQANTPWQTVLTAEDPSGNNPDDLSRWLPLSANLIQQGGFSSLGVNSAGNAIQEQPGTTLSVLPGGSIQLTGNSITVLGELSAPAGAITLISTGFSGDQAISPNANSTPLPTDITVGKGAVLNASGLWVNDSGLPVDNYTGDRYINGGNITLQTEQSVVTNSQAITPTTLADGTGSILLQPGSLLNVSSGGYVNGNDQLQLTNGIPDGSGGNISLLTYFEPKGGNIFAAQGGGPPPAALTARLQLDGTLRAFGFSGGGTLTLQTSDLQIGGSSNNLALSSGLYLNPGFFAGQGFDSYALSSVTDAVVAPGTTVQISRDNLLPNYPALLAAPTGTDIYGNSALTNTPYVSIGQLDPYLRYISRNPDAGPGFALSAGAYLDWQVVPGTLNAGAPTYAGVTGSVSLSAGAAILADAGATIQLAGTQSTLVNGTVDAPGGTINVLINPLVFNAAPSVPQLWLGPQAVLDAAGTSLINPLAAAVPGGSVGLGLASHFTPRTGMVLNGGNVTLTANDGYALTAQGSLIDVSGASDTYDLPSTVNTATGVQAAYTPTLVWSDGGSIVFSAGAGLYADGNLRADAGALQGEGGSLQIVGLNPSTTAFAQPSATGILLQQSGNLIPTGWKPGDSVEAGAPSGILHFALDHLSGSGITSLIIGPEVTATSQVVVPVAFTGNIDLTLARSFSLYAPTLTALPAGSTQWPSGTNTGYVQGNDIVQITAPYVEITGSNANGTPQAVAGNDVLDVNAAFMDLGGVLDLQGWSAANFTSSGDIRFYVPPNLQYAGNSGSMVPGMLFSTGNLSFKAAQLYPVSDYSFVIDANPSGLSNAQGQAISTTLTILGNGPGATPLSAGGGLLLDADHIEQDGTLRAPSGNLMIGVQDTASAANAFGLGSNAADYPLVATQSVHLAAGSITSVSLDGLTVPYGSTVDGERWTYDGNPQASSPVLSAPPSKTISIAGTDVSLDSGATIDMSGGGKLQASEWVPGVGGTRNVLTQYETSYANSTTGVQVPQYSDGRAVYAILPGYSAPVGAQDAALEKGAGAGPATGQSIYLSGMPGLPAGYYVLLPAKYATLPGAYRVVQDTSSQDSVLGQNAVLPDGTLSVTGYFADALDGARDARNTTFLVQSAPVWQQYSQYQFTNADSYFTAQASHAGTIAPALPADGGHLLLSATQQLQLGVVLDAAPASGGRGSLVDIAAQAIQVVDSGSTALPGYLQLSVDGLSALDAGSLMLGGSRQLGSNGYQVNSIADSVVLSNDAAHPLQGQEILLVANGNNDTGAQGIVLQSGSVLLASGAGTPNATPLIFGSNASTSANGASVPAVSGNGALLRVSQDGVASVTRNDVSGTTSGDLTIDAGATVQGGSSLVMDATGSISVSPSATFSAQNIDANSNLITFVGSNGTNTNAGGLVIGPGTLSLLSGAQQVTLSSRGAIDFLGNITIDLPQTLDLNANAFVSDGGQVSIKAATLGLGNAIGSSTATPVVGHGQLNLNADELDFTAGTSTLQGFGSVTAFASQGMTGQGSGGFDFGAATVSLNTPVLLADTGANTHLTTTGTLAINATTGTPLQNSAMGGALTLSGGSLTVGTQIAAAAGDLSLAATSGDLTVTDTASLNTAGINKTFFDITTYAPGGNLKLTSAQGSVIVQPGATIDFAGAPLGGDAGGITIQAANLAVLNGNFEGQAVSGYRGGYFTLSSGGALDLDQLASLTGKAGATGGISISSGAGDLVLSLGQSLVSQDVYLAANGGAGSVNSAAGVVQIDGTINASGAAAGDIQLYGRNGVDVNGSLLATSSIPEQRGGNVLIAITGSSDGTLNTTYGYENVQAGSAGTIQFGPNASINVSGGSPDAGGTVNLRAPLLANGDVPITFSGGTLAVTGANSVTIEPYAVWSTADKYTDPTKYFDGLIDPAGWYQYGPDGTPQLVAGTWTDATGAVLPAPTDAATLQAYLSTDYFTPTAADAAHQTFYGYVNGDPTQGAGTLMSYVEQPGYTFGNRFAGIANVQLRPGIELINPDAGINGGDISVLTNWNLGAGTTNANGVIQLAYRYQPTSASASGQAPILTVLALHNLDIDASITDGFYQQNNGPQLSAPVILTGGTTQLYNNALAAYNTANTYLDFGDPYFPGADQLWQGGSYFVNGNGNVSLTLDPYYEPIEAPLVNQSTAYYQNYMLYIGEVGAGSATYGPGITKWAYAYTQGDYAGYLPYAPTSLVAPQPASYAQYSSYVTAYQNWLTSNFNNNASQQTPSPLLLPLPTEASSNYSLYSSDYGTYINGFDSYFNYVSTQVGNVNAVGSGSQLFYAPFTPAANQASVQTAGGTADNSPSNMPSLGNPASLISATLLGGSSSSYRLVAGANFTGVDPLSVVANTGGGNVNLDGHFAVQYTANGGDGKTLDFPTAVRTGTGSIDIVSAGDINWQDQVAPAVVYTAGEPANGTTAGSGVSVLSTTTSISSMPDILASGLVNPDNAGNIVLSAQGNINAIEQVIDTSGSVTGAAGNDISQLWWPWMQTGNTATRSSINFANFDQGVMSAGGNVSVTAGGDIRDLSVSLPTTWYANAGGTAVTTVGGGNLTVNAGGDILSGTYFVAKGQGTLVAGGTIGSDIDYTVPANVNEIGGITTPVATLLGLQDAQFSVQAHDGVNIGGIYDPSYAVIDSTNLKLIPVGETDAQSYSSTSSVSILTTNGDTTLDSLSAPATLFSYGASESEAYAYNPGAVLPATLSLTALNGSVNILGGGGLYPSETGNLSLLASDSVNFAELVYTLNTASYNVNQSFGLIDASASDLPSPLQPSGVEAGNQTGIANLLIAGYLDNGLYNAYSRDLHQAIPLHGSDAVPVRIYALNGDIVDGTPAPNGVMMDQIILEPDKPALIYAGRDIVDLSLMGQQTHQSDITRIAAGRDIYDTPFYTGTLSIYRPLNEDYELVPSILLGGVGSLLVEAGRNIGPLTSQTDIQSPNNSSTYLTGIDTIGNQVNPYLPHDGANINVLFGVGPGIETSNFLTQYLSNPNGIDGFGSLLPDLISFMEQRQEGAIVDTGFAQDQINVVLTAQQAEAAFQQLPPYVQELFAQQEFFKLLTQVGADYNNPSSPYYQQYARGYAAIQSLFPASLGYTNNGSGKGGINGEASTIDTGDLDIPSSTIQTQQGGNISILGPGGQALIGSVEAPPVITDNRGNVIAGPNSMGILTLEQGSVDMFTDRSVLLAQSRIFTEQGGNMVIWSSNGDINAGQGAKTTEVVPPPTYLCSLDAFCLIDARGEVSGAGIATLQTIPGATSGNVYLVAPRGTVDAGDAGIRVSGNLVVAAAQIANADNIQVQGQKIGVPVTQSVNVGALNAAGAAAGAVSKVAQDMLKQQQNDALGKQPSIISVQVLGFGDGSTSIQENGSGYDPNSPVQILGAGRLSDARKKSLTEAERRQLVE
ncbi:filamentous haemagglutinin family protein [Dyella lipolytica]|uniref:Filamentous hemagglutinin family protein n=1 Tax=Dyella lipolytica TaxID=1867835 RepID=A0ABW8IY68_9GAMM|nr:filamentous haemagglutinin family protein [Dyella lipolytica]